MSDIGYLGVGLCVGLVWLAALGVVAVRWGGTPETPEDDDPFWQY